MDAESGKRLAEFVEKVGLLRRDLQQKGDLGTYEARVARIDQKLAAFVETLASTDPDLAKAIETAWRQPARSLAFRNADHQKS